LGDEKMGELHWNDVDTSPTSERLAPTVKRSSPESIQELLRARNEIDEIIKRKFKQKVTIMFTDIVGSTSYFQEKGDIEGRAMIQRHNDLLFPIIENSQGKIIKTIGDAIMACFIEEDMAITASLEMQQALSKYNQGREKDEEIHIRIGLHSGVGITEERDLFGNVVNLAARIESLACGDQILTSGTTYENSNKQRFNFHSHGFFPLKGIKSEIAVYEVLWHEGEKPKKPQMGVTVSEGAVRKQVNEIITSVFRRVDDAFEAEINKNFLFEFNGHNTDYLQLLSDDLKNLFFKRFNECNRTNEYNGICITGGEGVGKTFNSLLIGKKVRQQGYSVYYCDDVRDANLSERVIADIMGSFNEHDVFIIDNCQADEIKTGEIVARITRAEGYAGKPRFIFLTRPIDVDDIEDIFGKKVPILEFKRKYVDFEYLVGLFFEKIKLGEEKFNEFLSSLEHYDLSKALFKYRNMAFWNEFFKSIEDDYEVKIEERRFYERASRFLRKHEPYLIQTKDVLAKFLPFFMNGIPIHRDYTCDYLQITDEQIQKLEKEKAISIMELDWDNENWQNDTASFIVSKIHPTKARIIAAILEKYEGVEINLGSVITDYAKAYYKNLYYIITPFYEPETLEELCNNDELVSTVKRYMRERHLGKHLDGIIRTFSKLNPEVKDRLIDGEIIEFFAQKLNDKKPYIVSKLYLFRAIYKFSPSQTYELYKKFDKKVLIDDFNSEPKKRGIASFAKFFELFKNIFYFAGAKEKPLIINDIKEILDGCSKDFIERFDKSYEYFSQFHWLLKRLDPIRLVPYTKGSLSNYFLTKIPPAKIVEWIKSKHTRINELRFVFKTARFTFLEIDGVTRNLYHDYFKNSLDYDDIKRIFNRSKLYDIAITSKFGHEILANYFYQYSCEDDFIEKVSKGDLYLINESMDLIETNLGLSHIQKNFIISRIIEGCNFGEEFLNATIKEAKKRGKSIDIDYEKQRFFDFRNKYEGTSPSTA
jgi:class 3 adenylate cyclase